MTRRKHVGGGGGGGGLVEIGISIPTGTKANVTHFGASSDILKSQTQKPSEKVLPLGFIRKSRKRPRIRSQGFSYLFSITV